MKKFVMVLGASIFLSLVGSAQVKTFQNLIGSWQMVGDQAEGGSLQIIDSSTILIKFMGEEKSILRYSMDFSKSPAWFDFSCKDTSSVSNFKSIFEFIGDDTLKWQVFSDGERSNHFTGRAGDLFYLKRVKSPSNTAFSGN